MKKPVKAKFDAWLSEQTEDFHCGLCPLEYYMGCTSPTLSGDQLDDFPLWAQKFVDEFDKVFSWTYLSYSPEDALLILRSI